MAQSNPSQGQGQQSGQNHFSGLVSQVQNAPRNERPNTLIQGIATEMRNAHSEQEIQQRCQELTAEAANLSRALVA